MLSNQRSCAGAHVESLAKTCSLFNIDNNNLISSMESINTLNRTTMKIKMIMLCLVLGSWGAYAQHEHTAKKDDKKMDQSIATFKDTKLGVAYEHYIHLKDSLVASKNDEVKKRAIELQKPLKDVS